jgi:hypothetical protein
MKLKSWLASLASGLLLLGSVSLLNAPAASAAVSGSVDCTYGNNAEVGVWVSAGAQSGWATLRANAYGGADYYYGSLSSSTTYRLQVGCGGTPQNWGITFYTPYVSGGPYDWVCTTGYNCALS